MTKLSLSTALGFALAAIVSFQANAAPVQPGRPLPSETIQVSGGCGPNAWRGPWGHCRSTPYYGPLPGGYYQEAPMMGNGCPPGYWRGPWGHCRNTPYHGRLPDGQWK